MTAANTHLCELLKQKQKPKEINEQKEETEEEAEAKAKLRQRRPHRVGFLYMYVRGSETNDATTEAV